MQISSTFKHLLLLALFLLMASGASAQNFSWAAGLDGDWNDPLNWSPSGFPNGPGETATISINSGTPYTVTMNINPTLDGFLFDGGNATLAATGRSLTVNGPSTLGPGPGGTIVIWRDSSWSGSGTINNQLEFRSHGNSNITNALNQGATMIVRGDSTSGNATLTLSQALTNSGRFTLDSTGGNFDATLSMGGLFRNNNTLEFLAGSGGGRTYTGAELVNDANIRIETDTTFQTGPFTNNASFEVGVGSLLDFSNGRTFNQNTGTLDIQGRLFMNQGTMNLIGGIVNGRIELDDGVLNLGPSFTSSLDVLFIDLSNSMTGDVKVNQDVLIQAQDGAGTASLRPTASFTNSGTMRLNDIDSPRTVTLSLTNGTTLTNRNLLEFAQGVGGARVFTGGALLNEGTVRVAGNTTLQSGPFTNTSDFEILTGQLLDFGNGRTFNQDNGTLNIQGRIFMNAGTLNLNGGTVTGLVELDDCALNLASGFTSALDVLITDLSNSLSGDLKANQSILLRAQDGPAAAALRTTGSFSNAGTIRLEDIDTARTVTFTLAGGSTMTNQNLLDLAQGVGGQRIFNGGELVNDGTVRIAGNTTFRDGPFTNNATFDILSGQLLDFGNGRTFNQNSGTLDIQGRMLMNVGTLNLNGGTVTGLVELDDGVLNLAAGFTSALEVLMIDAGNSITGDVKANQSIVVRGRDTTGAAGLRAAASFTNAGSLRLEDVDSPRTVTLTLGTGTELTNQNLIEFAQGVGGQRVLSGGRLVNDGTIRVGGNTTFRDGPFTNNADFEIQAGQLLDFGSSRTFNQDGGTLNIQGRMFMNRGTLNLNAGTVTGTAELRAGILNLGTGFTSNLEVLLDDLGNQMTGDLLSGQLVRLEGNDGAGNASLAHTGSFRNEGTIRLDVPSGAPRNLTLGVPSGNTLTNAGSLIVAAGSGGGRTLDFELENTGTTSFEIAASLGRSGDDHRNSGRLSLQDPNSTVSLAGSSFSNQAGGRIEGVGILDATSTGLDNSGVVAPGLSSGELNLIGNYSQNSDGTLEIEIGGRTAGAEHDRLNVQGTADLAGTLEVSRLNAFIPTVADRFVILTATTIQGEFDQVVVDPPRSGYDVRAEYTATEVILRILPEGTPFPVGLVTLSGPSPGTAGVDNDFQIGHVFPNGDVALFTGTMSGTFPVSGCNGLQLGIDSATVLKTGRAGSDGTVSLQGKIPASASGSTLLFQAVDATSCRKSRVVSFSFP